MNLNLLLYLLLFVWKIYHGYVTCTYVLIMPEVTMHEKMFINAYASTYYIYELCKFHCVCGT